MQSRHCGPERRARGAVDRGYFPNIRLFDNLSLGVQGEVPTAPIQADFREDTAMAFKALIVDKAEDGTVSQSIETITEDRLPEAGVTVAVEYSTLNYKDGLCLTGRVRLPATVIPFLLRGVNLLGIDSVMQQRVPGPWIIMGRAF